MYSGCRNVSSDGTKPATFREQCVTKEDEIPTGNVQYTSRMHETMFIHSGTCSGHA